MKYRLRRLVEPRGSCCGSVDYTVGKDLPRGGYFGGIFSALDDVMGNAGVTSRTRLG
jgi:hypothetical protein